MGFMDKFRGIINPDSEYDDDDYEGMDGDDDYGFDEPAAPQQNTQSNNYAQNQSKNTMGSAMGLNSGALELKVVKPEKYDSVTAQKIADHLLNRRTVVLNLEATNKESARRLIDFLSGVAYSIEGYIQRVANNTFVIVPNNVDVSGEQLQETPKHDSTDLF